VQVDPLKRVWVIDRQHWPRALLCGELLESGLEAVGFESLEDALAAFEGVTALQPDLIIIELKGLGVAVDEGLARLARMNLPIILLGGAVELNEEAVRSGGWTAVLKRPFTLGRVAHLVSEQLQVSGGNPG
jgi:AmiR/NasT family two-component response regulator